jgi:hypothetical protein
MVSPRIRFLIVAAALVLLALVLVGWGLRSGVGGWVKQQWAARQIGGTPMDPNDPVWKAKLPEADPAAGLAPSPLNALLKPDLTPEQQTDIIGQLLLDYWTNLRSLPAGTWEETCAALAGANGKGLAFIPKDHPALGKDAFRTSPGAPGVRLHVISSSGGVFQLTFDGPDGKPYTDDDLIRNFPPDLTY